MLLGTSKTALFALAFGLWGLVALRSMVEPFLKYAEVAVREMSALRFLRLIFGVVQAFFTVLWGGTTIEN